MAGHTITVTLPDDLYAQLEAQVNSSAQSVDDLVTRGLARVLPPNPEGDLPPAIQTELAAMTHLSDKSLWAIADSIMNADKQALYDLMIERREAGSLTPDGGVCWRNCGTRRTR